MVQAGSRLAGGRMSRQPAIRKVCSHVDLDQVYRFNRLGRRFKGQPIHPISRVACIGGGRLRDGLGGRR
jgi:hypothetical protein